ncbi:hypothetical protein [Rugamonas rivuli]|uniref:Uncharacterized protein n=1 Tax=Rugamonas rivuli TaxID=2743358 RepID=A0A843SRQ8_9BURK|nr:hypothetical protein [Rugamonas rivuli]MQA23637.1 hypothetical protein [Rugamonas rivuli]
MMTATMYNFKFKTTLPPHSIQRALWLIKALDDFARPRQTNCQLQLPSSQIQDLIDKGPDADRGWEIFNTLKKKLDSPDYKASRNEVVLMLRCMVALAAHHAVHALLAKTPEESSDHFADGKYLLGGCEMLAWGGDDAIVMAAKGREGAKVTNSIWKPTEQDVFDWCSAHRHEYRSIQAAAIEVNKLFGVSVETSKKYIKAVDLTKKQLQ